MRIEASSTQAKYSTTSTRKMTIILRIKLCMIFSALYKHFPGARLFFQLPVVSHIRSE